MKHLKDQLYVNVKSRLKKCEPHPDIQLADVQEFIVKMLQTRPDYVQLTFNQKVFPDDCNLFYLETTIRNPIILQQLVNIKFQVGDKVIGYLFALDDLVSSLISFIEKKRKQTVKELRYDYDNPPIDTTIQRSERLSQYKDKSVEGIVTK